MLISPLCCVREFNVLPTFKVIWKQGQGLESHLTDLMSRESNLGPLGTRRVVYPLHHDGSSYFAYLYCCLGIGISFASVNFKNHKPVDF